MCFYNLFRKKLRPGSVQQGEGLLVPSPTQVSANSFESASYRSASPGVEKKSKTKTTFYIFSVSALFLTIAAGLYIFLQKTYCDDDLKEARGQVTSALTNLWRFFQENKECSKKLLSLRINEHIEVKIFNQKVPVFLNSTLGNLLGHSEVAMIEGVSTGFISHLQNLTWHANKLISSSYLYDFCEVSVYNVSSNISLTIIALGAFFSSLYKLVKSCQAEKETLGARFSF